MKTSNAQEFSSIAPTLAFKSLSTDDINELLLPFYLGLDFDQRRTRFGFGVSDSSIRQHCRDLNVNLNSDRASVLACLAPTGLIAAMELHSLHATWRHVELALANSPTKDQTVILGHLLQLAAFAVGRRGCNKLILTNVAPNCEVIELLRGMACVRFQGEDTFVDLDEYARLHNLISCS